MVQYRQPSPGIWPLLSFIFVAFLVEQSSTRLKVEAIAAQPHS